MAQMIPAMMGMFSAGGASAVGAAAGMGGTLLSTVGALQAGKSQQAMANYQAQLAEQRAKEERAVSIKQSQEERKKGALVASRARAVGAASGGGVDWEGLSDIDEETEIRAMNAIWEGEGRARDLRQQAAGSRAEGAAARKASKFQAAGTLLGGTDNLMYKYG